MAVEGLEGLGNIWIRIEVLKAFSGDETEGLAEFVERGYLPVTSLHDSQNLDMFEDIRDAIDSESTCFKLAESG